MQISKVEAILRALPAALERIVVVGTTQVYSRYSWPAKSSYLAGKASWLASGRPVVIHQAFGSGHAIMLGFDAWYRAWTQQEERLVLNGVLFPTGSPIAPPAARAARGADEAVTDTAGYNEEPADPIAEADLPAVADRPLSGTIDNIVTFQTTRDDIPR